MTSLAIPLERYTGRECLAERPLRQILPCDLGGTALATMLALPETYGLAVGPRGCLRRFYYVQRKFGPAGRIGTHRLAETDVVLGQCIAGFKESVRSLIRVEHPRLVACLSTCIADLLHMDYDLAASELEAETGVAVRMVRMNPLARRGVRPSSRYLYEAIARLLTSERRPQPAVNLFGPLGRIDRSSEIFQVLPDAGFRPVRQLAGHSDWPEFQAMALASHNLILTPPARYLAEIMKDNQGVPYLESPISYDLETISRRYEEMGEFLGKSLQVKWYRRQAASAIDRVLPELAGKRIAVGSDVVGDPFDIAKALVEAGLSVTDLFVENLSPYGMDAFSWLRKNAPSISVYPALHPGLVRHLPQWDHVDLALGLDAGFYCRQAGTAVLPVQQAGYGYRAAMRLFECLGEAVGRAGEYEGRIRDVNALSNACLFQG